MATNLITIGTGATDSAEIPLADGESAIVGIKATGEIPDGAGISVLVEYDTDVYQNVTSLDKYSRQWQIFGPATYLLRRPATSASCGAYRG